MADLTSVLTSPQPDNQLGFGNINPVTNAPVATSGWEQSEARRKREESATAGDYLGSMWRQDSAIPGLVEHYAGSTFVPQEDYFAATDPGFKDLSSGLWDEHVKELYQATSPAHAVFLKDRLLQKQEDLQRLGDMGWQGTAARFALGIFAPDQLLMSMAGGWVTKGAMAANAARVSKLAQAAASATRLQAAGKAPAVAAGLGTAAVENVAYEKLRQSVSFEDDTGLVVEAGLMGALFSSPFIAAGVRADRRVAHAAKKEHEVLQAMKAVEEGGELTPSQAATLREVHNTHQAITDLEAGRITPEEFNQRIDEFHGPVEPHDEWMTRFGDQLRSDTRSLIDELFPLQKAPVKAPSVSPEMRAQMDARVAREDAAFRPKEDAPADDAIPVPDWYNQQNPSLDNAMQSALRKALDKQKQSAEAARKPADLEALVGADEAAVRASKEDAWAQAERDRDARIKTDQERMIRAREEAASLLDMDPKERTLREAIDAEQAAPVAPQPHHAESFVGREVSWQGRDGETLDGKVTSFNAELGKVIVQTSEGKKAVLPENLDQWDGPGPEGFLHGSVGAAQHLKVIASIVDQKTAMSAARMDYFAILNRSEHPGVRELVFQLVKDAIQVDSKEAQGWTASEHKKQLQRAVGGNFHREVNAALAEALELEKVPMWRRREFTQQFMALVSRETRGDWTVAAHHQDIHPAVAKGAKAMKDAYSRMLEEAQGAGVKGAMDVPPNDLYVNRMWDHKGIHDAISMHGEDAVVSLLARAINVPGYIGDRVKAKSFLDTVRRLEHSGAFQGVHLQGRDMGTLRTTLKQHGLSDTDINNIVDVMFDARGAADADAGQTARLRFRFDLDENAAVNLKTGVLRMSDLFENDARVLVDSYINSMGGHVGLAKVGIDSQAAWSARLKEIGDEAVAAGKYDGKQLAKELKYLQQIHDHITGRPMDTSDFSNTARFAAALRGYTRAATLGQLGLTAAFEMARSVSLVGFRAMWHSAPTFRGFIRALRQGYVPDKKLAEDVMRMTGFGTEMASSYARMHELEGGFVGGTLTRFEKLANDLSHAGDVLSGNASFTSVTRNMTAQAAIRNAYDYASGAKKLTASMRKRWVAQGLDDHAIDSILADLKQHTTLQNGSVESIDVDSWASSSPGSYQRFQLFLSRQVRDAIQDQDIGETMPFMHTTLGKVLSELKTFMLVGHAKNMLKNAHFRDSTAVTLYMVSFVAECLAYSIQSAVNFPNELDKKLQPEEIAKAAWFRMSINGLAPLLVETSYNITSGGDSLLSPGTTANTDNRSLFKTPSFQTLTRLGSAPMTISGALLGTDVTTKAEMRDLFRALPFGRLYGLPSLGNWLTESMPKADPDKYRNQ